MILGEFVGGMFESIGELFGILSIEDGAFQGKKKIH